MSVPRRVADPRFALSTLRADLPALVDARRDETTLDERTAAVKRAWRDSDARQRAICDALGLTDGDVTVETVSSGALDANGRESAARTLVCRLDGTNRWGVLTDGRYWRLYGGGDPDEQRYHELDLRTLAAAAPASDGDYEGLDTKSHPANADSPLRHFVALFAHEAFEGGQSHDDSQSFLDALASADATRRASVRDSLCDGFVTAVGAICDSTNCPSSDAAAALVFRLAFDLFAADRTGSSLFSDRPDALYAVRDKLVADARAADGPTEAIVLDATERTILREWAVNAADSTLGGPFVSDWTPQSSSDADQTAPERTAPDRTAPEQSDSERTDPTRTETDRTTTERPGLDVSSLDDGTLEYVCALLTTVPCDDTWYSADYRTVDVRLLADAHERFLEAAFDGPSTAETTRRKTNGSFYTPESVVTYLAAQTAGSLVRDARTAASDESEPNVAADVRTRLLSRRVVDPAMGGGTLLVAVARRLASGIRRAARHADAPVESFASIRRAVVSQCLYGVDRNPAATTVAHLVCLAETLGPGANVETLPALADHLRCGDALLGPGPDPSRNDSLATPRNDALPGAIRWQEVFSDVFDSENSGRGGVGFDAVVGNPPWKGTAGRADISARIDGDTSAYLRKAFDSTNGPQPNLYAAFLERACRLAPDGYVAFVVPDALLVRLSVASARRFLLDSGGLTHLLRIGNVFADANEGAAIVVCGPEADSPDETGSADAIRTWFGDADAFATTVADGSFEYSGLRRETVENEEYARFQLLRDDVADGIFRKLERFEPFEAVGTVARGEEFGKSDERVRQTPAAGMRRLVPGSAVRRYALSARKIRYVPEVAVSKAVYDPPKLLCRQTGRFLVGALDIEGVANLKSVYDAHVRPRADGDRAGGGDSADDDGAGDDDSAGDDRVDADATDEKRLLLHLLGLLNSAVYNYYHYVRRNAYPAEFPQNNQRNYETLPVWAGSVDDELVELVERRLDIGRERASLDTDIESVVGFDEASVPLKQFDPEVVDSGLSRSHRGETPGLRIGSFSVQEERAAFTVRMRYETDDGFEASNGDETRDVLRFDALTPRDSLVVSTWLRAVGATTVTNRRACGLRPVGRSSQTTPVERLRELRVPDPETHAEALARYARNCRRASELDRHAESVDDRIDARVAELCDLTDAERTRVRETMAALPGWESIRQPSR
ncbi:SAM-dependent DNA methyltransferase [Halogeometricum borinquense]|uniref:site-specific DNA-methyltransferase (adenine-specific) n=1 Tax=Halogeometricum borinquense TaxID=60847 RepID=A0A6C0UEQ7_9EURY|nr:Eco57I restriction-modification methylase domain-containing protein [Halogeometricum borinquense]QIB73924.1 SAM-dependent DNA methyltransferase [Halogeometricum borinquense]